MYVYLNTLTSVCAQGLEVGDEVIQFGSVSAANFVNMQSIAAVVEHSKGVCYVACLHSLLELACLFILGQQVNLMMSKSCTYVCA